PRGTGGVPPRDNGLHLAFGYRGVAGLQVEVGGREIGQADGEDLLELAGESGEVGVAETIIARGSDDRGEGAGRVQVIRYGLVERLQVAGCRRAELVTRL